MIKNKKGRIFLVIAVLCFGVMVRLYKVDSPLLDMHHWRQTETEAVAYNFYHHGMNLFYPEVRWRGAPPNYLCSELQIFPWLVAAAWKISGVSSLVGRLLSILFYVLTSWYLFCLVRRVCDYWTALATLFMFAGIPVWLFFSRNFQPESFLLFLSVSSLYYFYVWLEERSFKSLSLAGVFFTLALLVKITVFPLGVLFFLLQFSRDRLVLFLNWRLWMFLIMACGVPLIWFYHAHQIHLQYGQAWIDVWGEIITGHAYKGYSNVENLKSSEFYQVVFHSRIYQEIFCRAGGFLFFLAGLISCWKFQKARWFYLWLVTSFLYMPFVSGHLFGHQYYIMPVVPVFAVFMGSGLAGIVSKTLSLRSVSAKIPLLVLTAVLWGSIAWNWSNVLGEWYKLNYPLIPVASYIRDHTPPDALVITYDGTGPTLLNISNRYGWFYTDPRDINVRSLRYYYQHEGARYFVSNRANRLKKRTLRYLMKHRVIFRTNIHLIVEFQDKW